MEEFKNLKNLEFNVRRGYLIFKHYQSFIQFCQTIINPRSSTKLKRKIVLKKRIRFFYNIMSYMNALRLSQGI